VDALVAYLSTVRVRNRPQLTGYPVSVSQIHWEEKNSREVEEGNSEQQNNEKYHRENQVIGNAK
jgi:hypothetical protein